MQGLWSESESQEIYPDSCAYTLHLQRISAAIHERNFSSSKWKKRLLGTFLTLQKKLELHVGFEQQIKHSGSSGRKKPKLDWTNIFILASLLVKI
jgi:carbohydrate-selective porin OprB